IPVDQTGIRLEVTATNILDGTSTSNQVYGIDNSAPVITINSPAESAQFNPGATVNIMATISDIVGTKGMGMRSMLNGPKDKTGSGIDEVYLTVFDPNGVIVVTDSTTAQVISKPLIVTEYGTYTINILAKDNVGNQAMANRNFIVTPATAPTISFTDIAWLNSVGSNNLSFTINAVVPVNVTANVITYPSGATLMGPLSVNPEGGIYTVILNGGMIPAGETSVRLQVIATDQFGNVTEANHYYGVDRSTPIITILNPVNGAEITLVDESTKVRIEAQISDLIPPLKNGGKNSSGSGIAGSRMVIIDPLGMVISDVTAGADTTEISKEITNLMLGTYTVRVTAWDNAGNQAMVSITFTMIAAPLPPAELAISDAYAYPNPSIDGTAKFAVTLTNGAYVKIHIYDFAGREVRTLSSSGKVQGKSKAEIVFDGRNNDGVKLARGAYFARVIANDGTKIVEKVVKIAIK
ncbi:MAG TPA: FlgD immunoglobulin-like domain containing protein, partial [Candidatus Cloacimonas acidaminovorans]|nr:FlgD immunoglobulin-like domain containing protein [Candidatus Cloacimonas acidaminovorans]HOS07441.1 FlgD immunoglobulin-like domain containing protein [Candidatus Cloacimonas acidaminovorans]HOT38646.1 FlgD immunoglobulin-like domain containing protein [Candidatus Cloacimonas acidaminovorans]HPC51403.1 FlgD immunoglobulin-like domain containing protein [Candidatus Cloacimonas acidaminovorans]HPL52389.1 FlgD immunoglobulin-like domain containing protein [Candidatus Cloacimonas acidaminovora